MLTVHPVELTSWSTRVANELRGVPEQGVFGFVEAPERCYGGQLLIDDELVEGILCDCPLEAAAQCINEARFWRAEEWT